MAREGGRGAPPAPRAAGCRGRRSVRDLPAVPEEAAGGEVNIGAELLPPPKAAALPATHASPPAAAG